MFCPGYKATLEGPAEKSQYIIESLSVTKDGQPFDDFEFFEIVDTTDFDKVAEKNIINHEKNLRQ
jgi:hypothetical protein